MFVNVESGRFKSDFIVDFYSPIDFSREKVYEEVKAFFGEKLFQPRVEELWVGENGELDPNYVHMMENSINYWEKKGDHNAVRRFSKELEGAHNIVKLILASSNKSTPLPIVVNASDPGDFYVDDFGKKKSVTHIWMKNSDKAGGWGYRVFSLPTKHAGIENHWKTLQDLAEIQKTANILGEMFTELTPESLIAFPVILSEMNGALDQLANRLGYESWDDVEERAAHQLELREDHMAAERRERIVENFTARIFLAVKDNRPEYYREALVAAMSDTMSIEAGKSDYIGMSADDISEEIEKNFQVALALQTKAFNKKSYQEVRDLGLGLGDLSSVYFHFLKMRKAFENPLVQEARSTGCGGSGSNYAVEWSLLSYDSSGINVLFAEQRDYVGKFGYDEIDSGSGVEPEGKYTEGTYEPGHCVLCGKDRQKVWSKEKGGCGVCSTCERTH